MWETKARCAQAPIDLPLRSIAVMAVTLASCGADSYDVTLPVFLRYSSRYSKVIIALRR